MAMTVRWLIAKLRKMPPTAKVAVSDHDQDHEAGEYSGSPCLVEETTGLLKERGYGVVIHL